MSKLDTTPIQPRTTFLLFETSQLYHSSSFQSASLLNLISLLCTHFPASRSTPYLYLVMAEQQQNLQALTEQYQKFEQGNTILMLHGIYLTPAAELQSNIQSRQKLESQQQENKQVQKVRRIRTI